MTVLALSVLLFALLRMLVALVNLLSGNWLRQTTESIESLVSVLIPARNEAHNLPVLLESLRQQSHTRLEVIVYDDESTDDTLQIIRDYCKKDSRFHYLEGGGLPDGWIGKNYACHRLADASTGEYLLFLDADVVTGPELVRQSLAYLRKYGLSMLSVFPVQKMHSLGEKITVPVMNWILASLLPMVLIRKSRWTAFAAANGQFMLFDAQAYRDNCFHERLKNNKVEDIVICRSMKSAGYRVHTLFANEQVSCRMYDGFRAAVYGFSKNVVNFFGNSYMAAFGFLLVTTLGWLAFVLANRPDLLIMYVVTLVLTRVFVSITSRQHVVTNILFMPLQQLSFVIMVIQSVNNQLSGKYVWKGRKLQ